jgi:cation diffusion facilitator CzcD-associated flavoprotein CzcO
MTNVSNLRRIAIIGSGFAGLCVAIQLKKRGVDSFTIFEKADRIGGTWRDNTYPGACCDVPAFSYCFSFEQKTDWSRKWAPQSEILGYMEHCARKYDLTRHIRFNTEIASARWDADKSLWCLKTASGEEVLAEVLVSGTGQLNRPMIPKIEGIENFAGKRFHSARWRHDLDLSGLSVAVVGNAASAIQFIPEIAPKVQKLNIFQRTPNWVVQRGDRAYTEAEKQRFARYRFLALGYRWLNYLKYEMNWPIFRRIKFFVDRTQKASEQYMRSTLKDPKLQEWQLPDYPFGAKRMLISDDYFPALNRENVEVIVSPIDHVVEKGIVTKDRRTIPADVIILATGFQSTSFLAPIEITGVGGRSLNDEWHGAPRAYLGMTIAGFPNLFLMYGPNTNLGHNSIIFMIECQTNYILDCLEQMESRGLAAIDLRREVMESFDDRIQRELQRTVWAATVKSWYKTADGRITNNWSGSTIRYWWETRHADLALYNQTVRRSRIQDSSPQHEAIATVAAG